MADYLKYCEIMYCFSSGADYPKTEVDIEQGEARMQLTFRWFEVQKNNIVKVTEVLQAADLWSIIPITEFEACIELGFTGLFEPK